MKLQSDMLHKFYLETSDGEMELADLVMKAVMDDGRNLSRLEADCGFSHPRLVNIIYAHKGKRPGIATLMIALMALGYEIRIEKSQ